MLSRALAFLQHRIARERRRAGKPEVYREEDRHWLRLTLGLCGHELQLLRTANGRRIERGVAARFHNLRRIAANVSVAVDVESQRHVPLNLLGEQSRRIVKWQLLVEHLRR